MRPCFRVNVKVPSGKRYCISSRAVSQTPSVSLTLCLGRLRPSTVFDPAPFLRVDAAGRPLCKTQQGISQSSPASAKLTNGFDNFSMSTTNCIIYFRSKLGKGSKTRAGRREVKGGSRLTLEKKEQNESREARGQGRPRFISLFCGPSPLNRTTPPLSPDNTTMPLLHICRAPLGRLGPHAAMPAWGAAAAVWALGCAGGGAGRDSDGEMERECVCQAVEQGGGLVFWDESGD